MKKMFFRFIVLFVLITVFQDIRAQHAIDTLIPVRGLSIAAPRPDNVERFIQFIDEELAKYRINTLILRVDWNYQYQSHPELSDSISLSKSEVINIVNTCKKHSINVIPQINLLGHQSWAGEIGNLLREYPEFDETPHIKLPKEYIWPNEDDLYCKSYCPLHPEIHCIIFDLIDELIEVFEATSFHAGMDEVFYIGDEKCPRCSGRDKAELFANEVMVIRNHLNGLGCKMWIWGDRLIDGKTTGIGMWEASMNNTHRAVDFIPKDVVICDWHYERPDPTATYFAQKGFDVITCPWNKAEVALLQLQNYTFQKKNIHPVTARRLKGFVHTVWSPAEIFLDNYYNADAEDGSVECFKSLFGKMNAL